MKRLENYQKPTNNDTHGYDGPIAISNGGQITPVAQDFLRASHAIVHDVSLKATFRESVQRFLVLKPTRSLDILPKPRLVWPKSAMYMRKEVAQSKH